MHISIEWHGEQFNINLAAKEDSEDFLSIKGCRIKEYSGGEFVGFPARKNEKSGKWWNHVWANDKFQAAVIEKAKASMPAEKPPETPPEKPQDFDDDYPF